MPGEEMGQISGPAYGQAEPCERKKAEPANELQSPFDKLEGSVRRLAESVVTLGNEYERRTEMLLERIRELEAPREREFREMAAKRLGLLGKIPGDPRSDCESVCASGFGSSPACEAMSKLRNLARGH